MKATSPQHIPARLRSAVDAVLSPSLAKARFRAPWGLMGAVLLSISPLLVAQVPDAAPAGGGAAPASGGAPAAQQAPASSPKSGGGKGDLGLSKQAGFDPGSDTLSWEGQHWNINNNRLFEARFEKYLNAPEETTAEDRAYQNIIRTILNDLAPENGTKNLDAAFHLLSQAARFDIDARLCDNLADAIYSAHKSLRYQDTLALAGEALDRRRSQEYWNAKHLSAGESVQTGNTQTTTGSGKNAKTTSQKQSFEDTSAQAQTTSNLAEIEIQRKANNVKSELTAIEAKVQFQTLALQFFMQRRFQHVLMATRFYRAIFTDGDTKLNLTKEQQSLFEKSGGMPPTIGTLDSMANEAIRDVREGVQAYDFLLQKNELESATKRLAESFTTGEYMPEIRTLPREKKRQALEFSHKSYQLISALDVKDYTLAEQIVQDLAKTAKDFDSSKPMAAVETAKTVAQMHLAKARNAALKGDNATLEAELSAATEIWPRNPQLAEVSKMIFSTGDVQQKALTDFDQLLGQKNYRQICDDAPRFIAATAQDQDRQGKLKLVMDYVKTIDTAILEANAMAQQNNYAGAWETVEKISAQYADDNKLSQTRANLTTEAAEFVRTLRGAQDLEKKDLLGSSLSWYLKAKKLYPGSSFAGDGIDRLVKKIVPET